MPKRGQQEDQPKGAPAWMVTYGDMMTLLLTFFVLIVSFSSIEQVKFKQAISSIQEGLGMWPESMSVLPEISFKDKTAEAEVTAMIVEEMAEYLEANHIVDMVEVYNTPAGIRLIISDPLLFETAKVNIRPQFAQLLNYITEMIRQRDFSEIRVEGHTDNIPINTPEFPSNWELSAGRALSVVKYMAFERGVDPAKLSAVGYGEWRPRAENATAEGRARNRRVEIYLENRKSDVDKILEF